MLVLASLTFLVAGCGGGSSGSSSSTAAQAGSSSASATQTTASPAGNSPTPARTATTAAAPSAAAGEALAAADAICVRRTSELAALPQPGKSLHALATAMRARAVVERRALGELEQLKPPAKFAVQYGRVLSYERAMLRRSVRAGEAAATGDAARARAAQAGANRGRLRALFAAVRAGMRDCSPPR